MFDSLQQDLDRPFFNVRQVAHTLGCPESALRKWIARKHLDLGKGTLDYYRSRFTPRDCAATALMQELTGPIGLTPSRASDAVEALTDDLVDFCRSLGGPGEPEQITVLVRFEPDGSVKRISPDQANVPRSFIDIDLTDILIPVLRKVQLAVADHEGLTPDQYLGRVWYRDDQDRRCMLSLNYHETREYIGLDNHRLALKYDGLELPPDEQCRFQELHDRHQQARLDLIPPARLEALLND